MSKITYKEKEYTLTVRRSMLIELEDQGISSARLKSIGEEAPLRLMATAIKVALGLDESPAEILDSYDDLESFSEAGRAVVEGLFGALQHPTPATKKVARKKR